VETGTHDLIHHIERGQGRAIYREQTVSTGKKLDLSLLWLIFPDDTLSGEGLGQNGRRLVFMDFVFF
jgi:hypothetical protein